jgi:hypothetical protein
MKAFILALCALALSSAEVAAVDRPSKCPFTHKLQKDKPAAKSDLEWFILADRLGIMVTGDNHRETNVIQYFQDGTCWFPSKGAWRHRYPVNSPEPSGPVAGDQGRRCHFQVSEGKICHTLDEDGSQICLDPIVNNGVEYHWLEPNPKNPWGYDVRFFLWNGQGYDRCWNAFRKKGEPFNPKNVSHKNIEGRQ